MPLLSTEDAPFGFLEPLHEYILNNALGLTWTNWPYLYVVPLAPLGVVCYLIQFEGTRRWRIPIGLLGFSLLAKAITAYRYDDIELNAFNNGTGIATMHLALKYIEYSFLKGPIVDPWVARGRSHILAAIDLAINSRMVGLGRIGVASGKNEPRGKDGAVSVDDDGFPHQKEPWLPYTNARRSRLASFWWHFWKSVVHYIAVDYTLAFLWRFGRSTIGNPHGMKGSIEAFVGQRRFVLFPRSSHPIPVSWILVEICIEICLGVGVWQGISWIYHTTACFAIGTGLWETQSWEIDIFDEPWKADSILDMWGRRWHQLFRHHFLLTSTHVLKALRLPVRPHFVLPLVFFFSGAMHALGQMAMSPVPNPSVLALFFIFSGFGAALEVAFRQVTGRRVGGIWGRLWTWTFFLVTGNSAAKAWLDGGLGGCRLVPTEWPYRPGPIIVDWLAHYVVDVAK